ncbi:phenol hydroxylase subunit [Paraburkholderia youngii]|uniref:phenol hydroxylase subunit n=1 Tax=Paraburkholderia youngii TaxID=2782701 RepID=UPI003D1BB2CA
MNHPQSLFWSTRRYVRITSRRDDGYVEFDFSVGDSDLTVELIMNDTMFEHFCRINEVQTLDADESGIERSRERWRFEG